MSTKEKLLSWLAHIPVSGDAGYRYTRRISELRVEDICDFYGIHLAIWQLRPLDLQVEFDLETVSGRTRYLAWCLIAGRKEYRSLLLLDEWWIQLNSPAVIPKTRYSNGISNLIKLLIKARPDLGVPAELATERDQLAALAWFWMSGGYKEIGMDYQEIPYWQKKFLLPEQESFLSSNYFNILMAARADLRKVFDIQKPEGKKGIENWLLTNGPIETPLVELIKIAPAAWKAPPSKPINELKKGVNLIGYAFGELGIGEDVRMAAHALYAVGIPFVVVDFSPGSEISQQDRSIEKWIGDPIYSVNIVCLTALEHLRYFLDQGSDTLVGRYNIGYWPWELSDWPKSWGHCLALVDEVWASSGLIYEAIRKVADLPVHLMPMCVQIPEAIVDRRIIRNIYNIPHESYTFVFSFDGKSSIRRKNPLAIVSSFLLAFPNNEDVSLVIKCMRPDAESPEWARILEISSYDSRIRIVNALLSKEKVLELYKSCDCFVSLHRAEGFGRGIAEAILLGLDVIATDHGGNTDFCRATGVRLVKYELVDIEPGDYIESDKKRWANPDVLDASLKMRDAFDERDKNIKADRKRLEGLFSAHAVGKRYKNRLRSIIPF